MGSLSSGRDRSLGNNQFTYDYYKLNIHQLNKLNLLKPGLELPWHLFAQEQKPFPINVHVDHLTAHYRQPEENALIPYNILITHTPCHFGGTRPWLICPNPLCQKRVAILYFNGLFLCRNCRQLRYQSQSLSAKSRAFIRAKKIREKLGWKHSCDRLQPKPKFMHSATYLALLLNHEHYMDKGMSLSKSFF